MKLPVRREPHWHLVAPGQHLGYRKVAERRGTWIARYTTPSGRRFQALAVADDTVDADGGRVLDYTQAVNRARQWFNDTSNADGHGIHHGPYSVRDAARTWIDAWKGSKTSKSNAEGDLKHHILPALGDIEVARLKRSQIQAWLLHLAKKPPVKMLARTESEKKLSPSRRSKILYDPDDPETIRKRRATANRIFNSLSAVLNLAYRNGHVTSKTEWETVEKFADVSRARREFLTVEEACRVLGACPEDFRNLVQAALITGCRYGELGHMKVQQYAASIHAISLVQGKTKREKWVYLTDEETAFFDECTKGKPPQELIFRRTDGESWNKSNQQERMAAALETAGIHRPIYFHTLRHTFASLLVMNGASLQLVANQLGHTSTRMADQHYAHLSPHYIGSTVRAIKPSYAPTIIPPRDPAVRSTSAKVLGIKKAV